MNAAHELRLTIGVQANIHYREALKKTADHAPEIELQDAIDILKQYTKQAAEAVRALNEEVANDQMTRVLTAFELLDDSFDVALGTNITLDEFQGFVRNCEEKVATKLKGIQEDEITVVYTAHDKGVIEKPSDLTTVKPCACGRVFDPEEQAVLEVLLGSVPANVTKQLSNCSTSFSLFHCEPFS